MEEFLAIAPDVKLGREVKIHRFVNLYGCEVGDHTKIGCFVEIQKNARIGRFCKISSHTFICEGVTIEDDVFVGHNVTFINDLYPRSVNAAGQLQTEADWHVESILVKRGASIGSSATILSRVTIGENAIIGAGSVVTRDVPPETIAAGNPARVLRRIVRHPDGKATPGAGGPEGVSSPAKPAGNLPDPEGRMLIRTCLSCDFHEAKEEQERFISYCRKENCWAQFSKCVAKEALRQFLEKENPALRFPAGTESPRQRGFPISLQTETP